jgi:hypothetical protein
VTELPGRGLARGLWELMSHYDDKHALVTCTLAAVHVVNFSGAEEGDKAEKGTKAVGRPPKKARRTDASGEFVKQLEGKGGGVGGGAGEEIAAEVFVVGRRCKLDSVVTRSLKRLVSSTLEHIK